jgi:hypothetical protein
MKSLLHDLRYSVRQLWSSPGFSVTAILSLALGIASTTAVFSVIYAVLMNPYPYRAPDRMVHMRLIDKSGQEGVWPNSSAMAGDSHFACGRGFFPDQRRQLDPDRA